MPWRGLFHGLDRETITVRFAGPWRSAPASFVAARCVRSFLVMVVHPSRNLGDSDTCRGTVEALRPHALGEEEASLERAVASDV